jgi:hypothetical protein
MRTQHVAPLGELVTVAYDLAARHSKDPHEISRLATQIVADIRRRSQAFDQARRDTANHRLSTPLHRSSP